MTDFDFTKDEVQEMADALVYEATGFRELAEKARAGSGPWAGASSVDEAMHYSTRADTLDKLAAKANEQIRAYETREREAGIRMEREATKRAIATYDDSVINGGHRG